MAAPAPLHLFRDKRWHADPYPTYAALRRDWPVARADWPRRGAGHWLVSRHADVHRVLSASGFSVERHRTDRGPLAPGEIEPSAAERREPLGGTMIHVDAPEHTRLRAPAAAAFTPQRVSSMRPRLEAMVDELLDEPARTGRFDLVESLAGPLPALVISELLGVPRELLRQFRAWSRTFVRRGPTFGPGPVSDEVLSAVASLQKCLHEMIDERRRELGDDLLSAMIREGDPHSALSDRELVGTSLLLLSAGFDTTTNLIGNGTLALIENPDAFDRLAAEPDLMPSAIEEFLRYDSPVQSVARVALQDFELSGTVLPKGAMAVLYLASANRDGDVFADPDTLDLGRQPNRHLAFAHGRHFCVGAHLARLTAHVAFSALVDRFGALSLAATGERGPNPGLRGFARLPIVAVPRRRGPRG